MGKEKKVFSVEREYPYYVGVLRLQGVALLQEMSDDGRLDEHYDSSVHSLKMELILEPSKMPQLIFTLKLPDGEHSVPSEAIPPERILCEYMRDVRKL